MNPSCSFSDSFLLRRTDLFCGSATHHHIRRYLFWRWGNVELLGIFHGRGNVWHFSRCDYVGWPWSRIPVDLGRADGFDAHSARSSPYMKSLGVAGKYSSALHNSNYATLRCNNTMK